MKKVFCLIVSILLSNFLFCETFIDSIMAKKVSYYCQENNEKALNLIQLDLHSIEENETFTTEEKLISKNLLAIETVNFLDNSTKNKKEAYILLSSLCLENDEFIGNSSYKDLNKWLLVSYADIKVRILEFLSTKEVYIESMNAKKMYQEAIKKDKKFAYAYNSFGFWLFFAPSIAGGGINDSYKNFNKALKYSTSNNETFLYCLSNSQILFEMKNYEKCNEMLLKASNLIPEEKITDSIRKLNEKGKNLYK